MIDMATAAHGPLQWDTVAAKVYIETSVPSAYVSERTDPGSLHRRAETRAWWEQQLHRYEPYTSDAVLYELTDGDWPGRQAALDLMAPIRTVEIHEEVTQVAERYVQEKLVPVEIGGDASHLAAACVHRMDFLLTWNIRHLANPNKIRHLSVINRRLGLPTPLIVTPEMLWLEDE